jgi:hypothetical protein
MFLLTPHSSLYINGSYNPTWINEKQILMVDRFNHKLKLLTENGDVVSTTVVQEGEPWEHQPGKENEQLLYQ